jgi:fructose-specific phosphotransferase system IIC component
VSPKRSSSQIVAVWAIIVVGIVACAVLFYRSSQSAVVSYAENESGYALASALRNVRPDATEQANREALRLVEERYGQEAFLMDSSGTIVLASSGSDRQGQNAFADAAVAAIGDQLSGDATEAKAWMGLGEPFGKAQCLVEANYDGEMGLYLVVENRAQDMFTQQRQQMATLSVMLLGILAVVVFMTTTVIQNYRRKIVELATTDEATGLANRKSFVSSYETLEEEGKLERATVFLLDIDFFKRINDTFGHTVGDEALLSVARTITGVVGEDGIVGRWGGDEFIGVLLLDPGEACWRIRRLVALVAESEPAEGVRLSVSVGAARVGAALGLNSMVERADEALYQSKKNGRGFLTVFEEGKTPSVAYEQAAAPAAVDKPASATQAGAAARDKASARTGRDRWATRPHLTEGLLAAVRRMIPFVAGGGILIALAFLVDGASIDVGSLSADARASFGSITPFAKALFTIGSTTFNFMLPVFAGFLAESLVGREAFVAGFAGGYISSQGNAGFVGAIAAGLLSAFVIRLMRNFVDEMPKGVSAVAPIVIYPIFSLLIMYLAVTLVVSPFVSVIDSSLSAWLAGLAQSNRLAAGATSAAMMAIDMGGPMNKVAYHFGVASIQTGGTDLMAAVMVGGMVPPCGIALATRIFPEGFDEKERGSALPTLLMGLSFITEGALPYVLTDVARVIPACILGSAVAGALSEALGCTLMAPHGGVFVIPVVGLPVQYLVALCVGAVVCAVALGLLKRMVPRRA